MNTQTSPQVFYQFLATDSQERKQWIRELLVEKKVYFRSREQLNDPNELRPQITFTGEHKQIREYVRNLIQDRWPIKLSPAKRLLEENKLIHRYRNTPEWVEEILHEVLDRIGIFCLSETLTEPLLWAHYANGHRGVCIEFDANCGLLLAAQRVIYSDQAPVINKLADNAEIVLQKSMFTKNMTWAYEKEWRVIARWDDKRRIERYLQQHDVPKDHALFMQSQHGPGHYAIPKEAIKGVILGSNTSADDEAFIRSTLDESKLEIPVERANLSRDGKVTIQK